MPHRRGDEPNGTSKAVAEVAVCPTGVGMNRINERSHLIHASMPHRRGDEPITLDIAMIFFYVCPTGVGMNRKFYHAEKSV